MDAITRCNRCDYFTSLGAGGGRRLVHIQRKNGGYTHQWWRTKRARRSPGGRP